MAIGRFGNDVGRRAYLEAYERAMGELPAVDAVHDVATTFGTVRAYEWTPPGADEVPVLLLPGRTAGAPMWSENLPDLLSHRRVIALDALGDAGMSVQETPLESFDDQAAWVDQTLAGLGIERVHSVGHSFGGATAAAHAVRYPGRLASLALLEPVFTLAWPPVSIFWWATIASLPVPKRWRDRALAAIGGTTVEEVRKSTPVGDMIAEGSTRFRASLPVPKPLSPEQIAALSMPLYIAIASTDSLAGGAKAAKKAQGIPGAQVEVWPDTTHSLPMQVHEKLGSRLLEFWRHADASTATS